MLQGEHSAILLTVIKLPFIIEIFVLSIFEWPLKTGFTVFYFSNHLKRFIAPLTFTGLQLQIDCHLFQFFNHKTDPTERINGVNG